MESNRIESLKEQIAKQQRHIEYLESVSGKTVNDEDILHEALKVGSKNLPGATVFKIAIQWYRDKLSNQS